jgi:23S rRNA (uracil1939-C5)-methyltransferase
VRDALVRIGRFPDPPLEPIVPASSEYHYRNKLEYSFTAGENGVDLGFHRAGRWDEVIGIEECLLTTDLGNAVRLAVRDWAREERLEAYDQETGSGYLRTSSCARAEHGQVLVVLVTAPGERFETGYFVDVLRASRRCARSTGRSTTRRPSRRTSRRSCSGATTRSRRRSSGSLPRAPVAFLQTNTEMAARLYELAREYAGSRVTRTSTTSTAARGRSGSRSRGARVRCGGSRSPRKPSRARSRTPS